MHSLMRRAVALLVTASVVASCGLVGDTSPPDHAPPFGPIQALEVRRLLGLGPGVGGFGGSGHRTFSAFALEDGRWAHAELLYVDQPLPDLVNPPSGGSLRGTSVEVPNRVTDGAAVLAERPPTVLDEVVGCVRVVVSSHDFLPVSVTARDEFMRNVEIGLTHWRADLPEDPCDGRAR